MKKSDTLEGYAVALCDVYRNGGGDIAKELFKESGLTFDDWMMKTKLENRDLDIIREIYND